MSMENWSSCFKTDAVFVKMVQGCSLNFSCLVFPGHCGNVGSSVINEHAMCDCELIEICCAHCSHYFVKYSTQKLKLKCF